MYAVKFLFVYMAKIPNTLSTKRIGFDDNNHQIAVSKGAEMAPKMWLLNNYDRNAA